MSAPFLGERLSAEQPADTNTADTSVQMKIAPVITLQINQAFFMSRMNRRRTRRIEATFEKPRVMYMATWAPE
jgi:hypothetical protein